jgi:hypothetical protein
MSDVTTRGTGRLARAARYGGTALVGILIVLLIAHVAWTNSGSNEWQLISDKNGVRIYSMKTPGYSLMKYKVDMHVDSKLSDVAFYLTDLHTGADLGAFDIKRLEQVPARPIFYAYDTYKLNLPKPFGTVEIMLINESSQNPQTKQVNVNVYAAPNKRPRDTSVPRIVHLSNNWTLTPLPGGGTDIESISEMDLGLPYVVANLAMPGVLDEESHKMREVLKGERYRNGKPAFISEPDTDRQVADAR